jgi:hypothetical protein
MIMILIVDSLMLALTFARTGLGNLNKTIGGISA